MPDITDKDVVITDSDVRLVEGLAYIAQTITYDDFELSLRADGIEITIPEEDKETPEGVGAAGFSPRLTAPTATNPYYLKKGKGGYNPCLLISGNSCLPNCVGYAHGRVKEIGGVTTDTKLPTCNAEDWYSVAQSNGFKTAKAPSLGDVIVWRSGNLWNGADGCGHVGVVEDIDKEGAITVSQSNYGGTRFFTTKHLPPYNITGQTFLGFIKNPYVTGGWKKDSKGWWYQYSDGTYPKNQWVTINNKTYHFDAQGYMQTGWIKLDGIWYFLSTKSGSEEGMMLTDKTIKWKGNIYHLGNDGKMFVGDHKPKMHFDKNGALIVEEYK